MSLCCNLIIKCLYVYHFDIGKGNFLRIVKENAKSRKKLPHRKERRGVGWGNRQGG